MVYGSCYYMYNYMFMVFWFKLGGGLVVKSLWYNVMYVNFIYIIYGMYRNIKIYVLVMRYRMYILIMDVIMFCLRYIIDYIFLGFLLFYYLFFIYKLVFLKRGVIFVVDDFINNIFWFSYEKIIYN